MRKPWTTCPECGCGPGEDHKRACLRRKGSPIMDYSRHPNNRGRETMRGPAPHPMQPLTEPVEHRATSTIDHHADVTRYVTFGDGRDQ